MQGAESATSTAAIFIRSAAAVRFDVDTGHGRGALWDSGGPTNTSSSSVFKAVGASCWIDQQITRCVQEVT